MKRTGERAGIYQESADLLENIPRFGDEAKMAAVKMADLCFRAECFFSFSFSRHSISVDGRFNLIDSRAWNSLNLLLFC